LGIAMKKSQLCKMNMLLRFVSFSHCLMLGGCVLQSQKPLFAENEGKLVLRQFGNSFVTFNRESGQWKKQDDVMKFTAVGNHYVVRDKNSDINILFAQLNDQWWVIQADEPGKPSIYPTYLLAKFEGRALMLNILSCKVLKNNKSLKDIISFKGEDCMANAQMTREKFVELTKSPEPTLLKIEAVK
jgi:hypothetical protein